MGVILCNWCSGNGRLKEWDYCTCTIYSPNPEMFAVHRVLRWQKTCKPKKHCAQIFSLLWTEMWQRRCCVEEDAVNHIWKGTLYCEMNGGHDVCWLFECTVVQWGGGPATNIHTLVVFCLFFSSGLEYSFLYFFYRIWDFVSFLKMGEFYLALIFESVQGTLQTFKKQSNYCVWSPV